MASIGSSVLGRALCPKVSWGAERGVISNVNPYGKAVVLTV